MKNEGHAIGIHSWDHYSPWDGLSAEQQEEQIRRTQEAFQAVIGQTSNLFRAPGGAPTNANTSGLYNYNWTVDSFDYYYPANTAANAQIVADNVFIGSFDSNIFTEQDQAYTQAVAIDTAHWSRPIILIHSIHPVDPPALELIIQGLQQRGYGFGWLPRSGDSPGNKIPITSGN